MSSPTSPSSPTTQSIDTTTTTSTSTTGTGTPASATLLFGFLVIFVALFAAFLILAIFWQYQRRRRAEAAIMLEFDESKGTYRGVPKMWEVWVQDEPGGDRWKWDGIRPLSVDADDTASSKQATSIVASRLRSPRTWSRLFRRGPVPPPPPPEEAQRHQQSDGPGAEAASLISNVRMSFVIAMPHADTPNRRQSALSHCSRVGENWRCKEYSIGTYHPPFREEFTH